MSVDRDRMTLDVMTYMLVETRISVRSIRLSIARAEEVWHGFSSVIAKSIMASFGAIKDDVKAIEDKLAEMEKELAEARKDAEQQD